MTAVGRALYLHTPEGYGGSDLSAAEEAAVAEQLSFARAHVEELRSKLAEWEARFVAQRAEFEGQVAEAEAAAAAAVRAVGTELQAARDAAVLCAP